MPRKALLFTLILCLLSYGTAFDWSFGEWSSGDQQYSFEIYMGEGADLATIAIDTFITDTGGQFDVVTNLRIEHTGVAPSDLTTIVMGGSSLGMFAFGPMLLYGPSFFMLPMMLGQEEIRIRSEPIRVMGMGNIYMDKSEMVAGFECVVLRLELDQDDSVMEFALAEDLPLPCFSRYGEGEDRIELRLTKAHMAQ